ncbi:MAG: hypothetical protein PHU43_11530 [Candidatus Bipolaricaulis sp.]|nr:hypothetical protein [Candidatus Bipolaricaulis sp.]
MSNKITAYKGDTFVKSLAFKDSAAAAIDITGWTIWFTIKNSTDDADADAIIQKKITVHTSPAAGLSAISMTAAETDSFDSTYKYDIQIKKADGTIRTVLEDTITFTKDVTRSTT